MEARNPARRSLQRQDRAAAIIPLHRLQARGSAFGDAWELAALAVLAFCGFAAVGLAVW